jgi:hypothetical protein
MIPLVKDFSIRRPKPQRLVIEQPRLQQWVTIISKLAGITIWYVVSLPMLSNLPDVSVYGISIDSFSDQLFWIAVLLPVVSFPSLWSDLAYLRRGGIVFDGMSQTISRAARKLGLFGDVDVVDIKEFGDSEGGPSEYQLSVILKNGQTLAVARSAYYDDIVELAVELSNLLKVKVIKPAKKNRLPRYWDDKAWETRIDLPYTASSLVQVLRLALKPADARYTQEDIVNWCDNFLCEYQDVEIPPDVARVLPILTEIREQWSALSDRRMSSRHADPNSSKNVHLSVERLRDWLRRIEAGSN